MDGRIVSSPDVILGPRWYPLTHYDIICWSFSILSVIPDCYIQIAEMGRV